MSLTRYGVGEESDQLAHENGRRVTQKRDGKTNHRERRKVIVLNYAHGKCPLHGYRRRRMERIELVVDDIGAEVRRLRAAGLKFRNDIVTGPGGSQILLEDPSGNVVELFQPAAQ